MATSQQEVGKLGELFSADFASVKLRFENCEGDIVERRKVFKKSAITAIRDFDKLKSKLDSWRNSVSTGENQADHETEKVFLAAFNRWLCVANFLMQVWDANEQIDIHPSGWLRHRTVTATRIVENWKTPVAEIPSSVAKFLCSLNVGRTQEDLQRLDQLAEEAIQRQRGCKGQAHDEWAEKLAESLIQHED